MHVKQFSCVCKGKIDNSSERTIPSNFRVYENIEIRIIIRLNCQFCEFQMLLLRKNHKFYWSSNCIRNNFINWWFYIRPQSASLIWYKLVSMQKCICIFAGESIEKGFAKFWNDMETTSTNSNQPQMVTFNMMKLGMETTNYPWELYTNVFQTILYVKIEPV